MYKYQYINCHTGGGRWLNNLPAFHRELIDREARDGWRYVGFVPTDFTRLGGIKAVDLIFEREAEHDTDAL